MAKRKLKSQRKRRAGFSGIDRRIHTEESPIKLSWSEVFRSQPLFFSGTIQYWLGRRTADSIATDRRFSRRNYLLAVFLMSILSFLGVGIYAAAGGYKHFSIGYLALFPILGFAGGCLLSLLYMLLFYFIWEKGAFRVRKTILLKELFLVFAAAPLAWNSFPARILFPEWENPIWTVWLALGGLGLLKRGFEPNSHFRRGDYLLYGITGLVLHSLFLYYLPALTNALVRFLQIPVI